MLSGGEVSMADYIKSALRQGADVSYLRLAVCAPGGTNDV